MVATYGSPIRAPRTCFCLPSSFSVFVASGIWSNIAIPCNFWWLTHSPGTAGNLANLKVNIVPGSLRPIHEAPAIEQKVYKDMEHLSPGRSNPCRRRPLGQIRFMSIMLRLLVGMNACLSLHIFVLAAGASRVIQRDPACIVFFFKDSLLGEDCES